MNMRIKKEYKRLRIKKITIIKHLTTQYWKTQRDKTNPRIALKKIKTNKSQTINKLRIIMIITVVDNLISQVSNNKKIKKLLKSLE